MNTRKAAVLLAAALLPVSAMTMLGASPAPLTQPDVAAGGGAPHQAPHGPIITVSGSGEVERTPDYAVVTVGVQVREQSATDASKNAGDVIKKVNDAVRALDLDGMKLQTSGVSLNPAYSWRQGADGEQTQKLLGYDATVTLRVRVGDPASIGKVIDAAVNAGANRIHGVSFEIAGALGARQEALTMAAKAARDKADTLAAALGLRITGVVTATTASDAQPWQPMSNEVRFAQAAAGGMGESIEPGTVTVRAEATVTFSAAPIQ